MVLLSLAVFDCRSLNRSLFEGGPFLFGYQRGAVKAFCLGISGQDRIEPGGQGLGEGSGGKNECCDEGKKGFHEKDFKL